MTTITIRGHAISVIPARDSFDRRAQQYANRIIENLRRLGISIDDIDLEPERQAFRRMPAEIRWYMDGHHLYYSYGLAGAYVDNLNVALKVLDAEISALLKGDITRDEFISGFSESVDVVKERAEARELLGVDKDCHDLKVIDRKYKDLAKEHHPDMPNGSHEEFKKINKAHKLLRKELL